MSAHFGQFTEEGGEFGIISPDSVLRRRVPAGFDIALEFAKGGDALLLQAAVFGCKVAVAFGMARIVAGVRAKDVFREEILSIASLVHRPWR